VILSPSIVILAAGLKFNCMDGVAPVSGLIVTMPNFIAAVNVP
jgi:hypothetical protein